MLIVKNFYLTYILLTSFVSVSGPVLPEPAVAGSVSHAALRPVEAGVAAAATPVTTPVPAAAALRRARARSGHVDTMMTHRQASRMKPTVVRSRIDVSNARRTHEISVDLASVAARRPAGRAMLTLLVRMQDTQWQGTVSRRVREEVWASQRGSASGASVQTHYGPSCQRLLDDA